MFEGKGMTTREVENSRERKRKRSKEGSPYVHADEEGSYSRSKKKHSS